MMKMKRLALLLLATPSIIVGGFDAIADDNDVTVHIMSGRQNGTYARFAQDMADALDADGKLRIIPKLGRGSIQNLYDLRYLNNVDLAFVQSDVIASVHDSDVLPKFKKAKSEGFLNQIGYIQAFQEEIQILTNNSNVTSFEDFNDKTIGIGGERSGTAFTARRLLEHAWNLTENKDYTSVHLTADETIIGLINGDIDIGIIVAATPHTYFQPIKNLRNSNKTNSPSELIPPDIIERAKNIKMVTIEIPDIPKKLLGYTESEVEYFGNVVNTISVRAVLLAWTHWDADSDRCKRLKIFSKALKNNLIDIKNNAGDNKKYHDDWIDFTLGASKDLPEEMSYFNVTKPCTK